MKKRILFATAVASLFCFAAVAFAGRAHAEPAAAIDVAFSPNGGVEQLIVRTIASAQRSIRVMAYSLTSPAIVRALISAHRRGVAVAVTVDQTPAATPEPTPQRWITPTSGYCIAYG
ncbi:phospholipase D-like domain-containing protein [Burkholderia sp. Nafp2/4-1b]|uniref:phospholipase D-like domain-containing protein n=1 Tax=Burkholderia sp. Nafp2/4-1b TaxID=2116686 RepID=UPI001F09126E|nr:phospholipase D-like domain-containing protein [Burkholderia sp. Nafp2/4-1b]